MDIKSIKLIRNILLTIFLVSEFLCIAYFFLFAGRTNFQCNMIMFTIGMIGSLTESSFEQKMLLFAMIAFVVVLIVLPILCCFMNYRFVVAINVVFMIDIFIAIAVFVSSPEVIAVILLDIFFLVVINVAAHLTKRINSQPEN